MTDCPIKVIIFFARLGPYHHARLRSTAQVTNLTAIEYSNLDLTYAWETVTTATPFQKITLFNNCAYEDKSTLAKQTVLNSYLSQIRPDVVVIAGWSNPLALITLVWCRQRGIPVILMSESTEYDETRRFWKELVKHRILKNISTALVGGQLHRDYLVKLGLPQDRVFLGYDVVDNSHFSQGVTQACQKSIQLRQNLRLPQQFFLASARFVEKKNLHRLLSAYAQYQIQAGEDAWPLVLLGDGPLKARLCQQIEQLGLSNWVYLPGFKQYDELPSYYGLANCFIHASTTEQWGLVVNEAMASGLPVLVSDRCGCAPDLVRNGQNGYTFDPYNTNQLTELMFKVSSETCDLTTMGQASQTIIAQWTPQTFAANLQKAAEMALRLPQPKMSFLDITLLWALSRR